MGTERGGKVQTILVPCKLSPPFELFGCSFQIMPKPAANPNIGSFEMPLALLLRFSTHHETQTGTDESNFLRRARTPRNRSLRTRSESAHTQKIGVDLTCASWAAEKCICVATCLQMFVTRSALSHADSKELLISCFEFFDFWAVKTILPEDFQTILKIKVWTQSFTFRTSAFHKRHSC